MDKVDAAHFDREAARRLGARGHISIEVHDNDRMGEARWGKDGFTKQYHVHKLEYYEETTDVHSALEREKQLKRWSRKKKDGLISRMNPNWDDLYPDGIPRLRPASFARDDNG